MTNTRQRKRKSSKTQASQDKTLTSIATESAKTDPLSAKTNSTKRKTTKDSKLLPQNQPRNTANQSSRSKEAGKKASSDPSTIFKLPNHSLLHKKAASEVSNNNNSSRRVDKDKSADEDSDEKEEDVVEEVEPMNNGDSVDLTTSSNKVKKSRRSRNIAKARPSSKSRGRKRKSTSSGGSRAKSPRSFYRLSSKKSKLSQPPAISDVLHKKAASKVLNVVEFVVEGEAEEVELMNSGDSVDMTTSSNRVQKSRHDRNSRRARSSSKSSTRGRKRNSTSSGGSRTKSPPSSSRSSSKNPAKERKRHVSSLEKLLNQ